MQSFTHVFIFASFSWLKPATAHQKPLSSVKTISGKISVFASQFTGNFIVTLWFHVECLFTQRHLVISLFTSVFFLIFFDGFSPPYGTNLIIMDLKTVHYHSVEIWAFNLSM